MRGLTFWRPWTDAILRGSKRCENRGWPPPGWMLGHPIALHAGRRYQRGDWPWPDGFEPPPKDESPEGIVGVATLLGCLDRRGPARHVQMTVVGIEDAGALSRRIYSLDEDPWWSGPCGWLLGNVTVLPRPIPCRGYQKLWTLPTAVEVEVLAQVEEVRARG